MVRTSTGTDLYVSVATSYLLAFLLGDLLESIAGAVEVTMSQPGNALETAFCQPLKRLLTEGIQDGSLRPLSDVSNAALTIFGAVTVAGLTGAVAEPDQTSKFIDQTAAAVMDLLVEGLRPRT